MQGRAIAHRRVVNFTSGQGVLFSSTTSTLPVDRRWSWNFAPARSPSTRSTRIAATTQVSTARSTPDESLVGGLLRVFAEEHDPSGVERAVDVVVAAMDVERVLGERASAHFEDHGGGFAGSVIVLLNAVDDALAGGEVDHPLAANRVGDGAALGRVLALSLDGNGVLPEDVQVAFSIGLLEELAALRGRRNRIEDAGVGDPRLGVVRDKLVSIRSNPNSGKTSSSSHEFLSVSPVLSSQCHRCAAGGRLDRRATGWVISNRPRNGLAIRWGKQPSTLVCTQSKGTVYQYVVLSLPSPMNRLFQLLEPKTGRSEGYTSPMPVALLDARLSHAIPAPYRWLKAISPEFKPWRRYSSSHALSMFILTFQQGSNVLP